MKKLLLVLACAASLGLWMSCENEAQELDVTLHSGLIKDSYTNYGTATATKVTMVTKNTNIKVTYDDKNGLPNNMPKDNKGYYIGTVGTLKTEGDETILERTEYWFYNEWDNGTKVDFDSAKITWLGDVSYTNTTTTATGSSSTSANNIVGNNKVSNGKSYTFSFSLINDDDTIGNSVKILKSGDVYQYETDTSTYGTAKLDVTGNMEGNFTIGTLLKKLDSQYGTEDAYGDLSGTKYTRLDEQTIYEPYGGHYDSENNKWVYEYRARKIPADTSVYYLKDVAFTKN